eukprot:g10301.t1
MEQAISSGESGNVITLLSRIDGDSERRQLVGCYGGRGEGHDLKEDDNGLFKMTTPLMHAAYTGNLSMFSTVHDAMRQKLRKKQIKIKIPVPLALVLGGSAGMEQAISSGEPSNVNALLSRTDGDSERRQLMGCYGGRGEGSHHKKNDNGLFKMTTPLLHAAYTGNLSMFSTVYDAMRLKLRKKQVNTAITATDLGSRSILAMAALSKNENMLRIALTTLEEHLSEDEVKEVMMAGSHEYGYILNWAAASGCRNIFEATLVILRRRTSEDEVKDMMMGADAEHKATDKNVLQGAIQSGRVAMFDAVRADLTSPELEEVMTAGPTNVLHTAAECGNVDMFLAVLAALQELVPLKVEEMISARAEFGGSTLHFAAKSGNRAMFSTALSVVEEDKIKPMMTTILTTPSEERGGDGSLLHAAAKSGNAEVFGAVLGTMEAKLTPDEVEVEVRSTMNHWSNLLHAAASSGSEAVVEEVLATIKDKLGSEGVETMLGSEAGVEYMDLDGFVFRYIRPPLASSTSKDVFEAILTSPAVDMSLIETRKKVLADMLHAATWEGCVGMWEAAMRMGGEKISELDFQEPEQLLRQAIFSRDPATIRVTYGFLLERTLVEKARAITEVRELRRDFTLFIADHWNPIDFLGVGLVASGVVVRLADRTSPWGQTLYALSVPLLFSRVLFFAQILRFQGPIIQVIFSMISELAKFGIIIVIIMFGFAMSFYALFRDVDTFGHTFLTLFKGMLGEVGFFDEFQDNEFDEVATALFVIYLVVISIMLLNLLIAVLSTAHATVQGKAEQEFRVSRARLIGHYRLVVDEHLLPPPFNLVQLVVSLPFSGSGCDLGAGFGNNVSRCTVSRCTVLRKNLKA